MMPKDMAGVKDEKGLVGRKDKRKSLIDKSAMLKIYARLANLNGNKFQRTQRFINNKIKQHENKKYFNSCNCAGFYVACLLQ